MKIWKIVSNIILVAAIALAAVLVLPRVFGLTPMVVLSGSMEPTYHVGSMIYVSKTEPAAIEVGDAITFRIGGEDTLVTHRVIEKDETNQVFTTQGDNNDVPDGSPVAFSNVVGTPVFTIPMLGYLASWLNTRQGTILLITVILVILIITVMSEVLQKLDRDEKNGKAAEDGQEQERRAE